MSTSINEIMTMLAAMQGSDGELPLLTYENYKPTGDFVSSDGSIKYGHTKFGHCKANMFLMPDPLEGKVGLYFGAYLRPREEGEDDPDTEQERMELAQRGMALFGADQIVEVANMIRYSAACMTDPRNYWFKQDGTPGPMHPGDPTELFTRLNPNASAEEREEAIKSAHENMEAIRDLTMTHGAEVGLSAVLNWVDYDLSGDAFVEGEGINFGPGWYELLGNAHIAIAAVNTRVLGVTLGEFNEYTTGGDMSGESCIALQSMLPLEGARLAHSLMELAHAVERHGGSTRA